MSQPPVPPSVLLENVINGISKLKHTSSISESFPAAMKIFHDNYDTEDLGLIIVNFMKKKEKNDVIETFLTQLEYLDIGVLALAGSPSIILAIQSIIDSKSIKALNAVLDILSKSFVLSQDNDSSTVSTLPTLPIKHEELEKLLNILIQLIPTENLNVSDSACRLTETIIRKSESPDSYLTKLCTDSSRYLTSDKSLYVRFANILARVLGKDNRLFTACDNCKATEAIISICQYSQDILVQIVSMELLNEFAKTSLGLQYLFNNQIIQWLISTPTGENASLLGTQALHQIGDIFVTAKTNKLIDNDLWQSINTSTLAQLLEVSTTYLDSRVETDRLAALHAISGFSSCCYGALSLVMR